MKVLVSDPIAPQGVEILKDAGFEVTEQSGLTTQLL
jgi:hypothetical protein